MGYDDDELISGARVKDTGRNRVRDDSSDSTPRAFRSSRRLAARAAQGKETEGTIYGLIYDMEPGERREFAHKVISVLSPFREQPYTEHEETEQSRKKRYNAENRLWAEADTGYNPRDPEGALEPLRPGERNYWASLLSARDGSGPDTGNPERDYWASLLSARGGSGSDTGNPLIDGMSLDDDFIGPPEAPKSDYDKWYEEATAANDGLPPEIIDVPEAPPVELGPPEAPKAEIDREIERLETRPQGYTESKRLQELRARKEASATYYRMKK